VDRCPPTEQLAGLLDERLGETERQAVADHLESCPACRLRLEGVAGSAPLPCPVPEPAVSAPGPRPEFLAGLKRAGPPPPEQETLPVVPDAEFRPAVPGYEILQELGRGGMGIVYQARQVALNRVVALKVIRAGAGAGAQELERFRIEAEAVARLQHPHIVQIHEIGEQAGCPYFALEFVEGGTLAQRLAGTPLASRQAAALLETLARAMHHAHERGILHRDLKPGNVLLTADGTPKISDFGLAKYLDEALAPTVLARQTQSGAVLGTPSYMAPEQAQGKNKEIGPAADVYALGAILYELLTGRPPFKAATPLETLRQVIWDEPVPPARLQPKVPRDLETLCLKCVQKEPGKRYPSALALAEDLRRFLAGEPIRARPVGRGERLWRWCRRNPALSTASGVAALTLLAVVALAIGFGLYQSRAAADLRQEKQQTEAARNKSERHAATLALDQGLALCEQGEIGRGMLWLAHGLEIAPAAAADLRYAIRANLAAWRLQLTSLQMSLPHQGSVRAVSFSPDGKTLVTSSELMNAERTMLDRMEARLWEAATGNPLGPPLQHPARVSFVAFSPGGKTILTVSRADKTARLWEAATGKPIGPPLQQEVSGQGVFSPDGRTMLIQGDAGAPQLWDTATATPLGPPLRQQVGQYGMAVSPDGRTVVTAQPDSYPDTAQLWDAVTGQRIGPPLQYQGRVDKVAFSPDGKTVLIANTDTNQGTVRLWAAATGRSIGQPLQNRKAIGAAAFSPDSRLVLTGCIDGTARLWEAATGQPLGPPMLHQRSIWRVAFSPDGRSALTAAADSTARLWEVPTGRPIGGPLAHRDWLDGAAFSPDGRMVMTWSSDAARLWEAATGKPIGQPLPHLDEVEAMAFGPDGRTIVTGSRDKTARLWEVAPGSSLGPLLGHQGAVHTVAFSPDGRTVLTGSVDATARLWDRATGRPRGQPLRHGNQVVWAAYSRDGRRVVTASSGTARLWDAATGKSCGQVLSPGAAIDAVALSPDGQTVLTLARTVRLWEAATGKPLGQPFPQEAPVEAAAFSPDGKTVLTGDRAGTGRLWEGATGKPVGRPLRHEDSISGVDFSPDGKTVVTGSTDKTARLWDVSTGEPLGIPLAHQDAVRAVAFSPDGRLVLTRTRGGSARLWQAGTGQPLGPPLPSQVKVRVTAFSPDSKMVFTAGGVVLGYRGEGQLWDTGTGKPIGPRRLHQDVINSAAFSPDGRTILTGSDDQTARLWAVPAPVEEEVQRIGLWVQGITGLELDADGAVGKLDAQAWRERRQRLEQLGGPPRP
jgi:WD40 repeat protein